MRYGKSAGGEMHLSATVYCVLCGMMVEIGTDDCPHAIQLGEKKTTRVKDPTTWTEEFKTGFHEGVKRTEQAFQAHVDDWPSRGDCENNCSCGIILEGLAKKLKQKQ